VQRYFTRQGSQAMVDPSLRKQIVFARHNIIKDPPFIKNDIVTCRNMLIYMNSILQRKVFATLQFSLNLGGCLFLGPSEVPSSVKESFEEINGKWRIFRKISNENRFLPERMYGNFQKNIKDLKTATHPKDNPALRELNEDFQKILTEEYGFAAVYVDRNLEIKEAVGDFRKYLTLPDRIASLQLLKMVGSELGIALNAAIRKATKENTKVSLQHVKMKVGDKEKNVNIFVRPAPRDNYMLVVFGEGHEMPFVKQPETVAVSSSEGGAYLTELEEELKETRSNLQLAVESLETANEELQSSNEELLSANEELQSSNEELQSLNEELHTLNTEHQLRIKELIELNDDLNNYFRSTEIAQIFIDRQLRIRKFNPMAVKMVNLIEGDIGRPIEHLSTNIRTSSFMADIRKSLEKGAIIEREVQLASGPTCLMRILPYERQDRVPDGVVVTFVDISKLKELDNIIKGVFNTSVSAIMAFRCMRNEKNQVSDFVWIASNYAADALMEKQHPDYTGHSLREVYPELTKKGVFEKVVQVVETGRTLHTEIQLHRGEVPEWFELVANRMMDGVVITLTNIHDKKKADEKFRANYHELMKAKENYRNLNIALEEKVKERTFELSQGEERFRLIANATSDAIWDWDLVNNQIWWSDSFYTRFGYQRSQQEQSGNFWKEHIHKEDRDRVEKEINNAINSASSWSGKYRFMKADGNFASILDRGQVLTDSNGTPYRMVGAMMDISESELAESKLKEKNDELHLLIQEFGFVTDFMPQMVWATQQNGHHDFFNKRWYDYTGLSFEQSRDHGWMLVLHADDYQRTMELWQESLEKGTTYQAEYRMRRYDGIYRWFLARAIPLRDDQGTIVKWFGTCTDIHDQKMASDILEQKVKERTVELQRINLELESSNNELLQFASVASHDLKEPLRKIHMFGNLIKDRYLAQMDGAADYMERIISSSARMTKLINDLLTFTRLSVSSAFVKVDMNKVLDEVKSDLELSIDEKKAVIESNRLPEMEIISGQIRQVFQNIISNALKFSRPDVDPKVQIHSEIVDAARFDANPDPDGGYCRITISDNGIGFENQYAEKIFTIFQRLHPREKFEGTGIGLAITRKIIERHNGIIRAESREGEGATFVMVLPLRQETEPEVAANPQLN
jgi:two-component system CheB/CheR fusion protein